MKFPSKWSKILLVVLCHVGTDHSVLIVASDDHHATAASSVCIRRDSYDAYTRFSQVLRKVVVRAQSHKYSSCERAHKASGYDVEYQHRFREKAGEQTPTAQPPRLIGYDSCTVEHRNLGCSTE